MIDEWTIDRMAAINEESQGRRYRGLWLLEALLFPAWIATWMLASRDRDTIMVTFAVINTVQIPILICLVSRLVGRPITLDLGERSAATRAYVAELRRREPMSDTDFIRLSRLTSTEIVDYVGGVRAELQNFDPLCDRVFLHEPMGYLLDDADYADIYFLLARRFALTTIPFTSGHDGSIGMILNDVARAGSTAC